MSETCLALGLWVLNAPDECQMLEIDAAARLSQNFPMGGIHRAFELPRARVGLGLAKEDSHVRAIWGTVRSAGDSSYIGIDGESYVPQLQLMELAWHKGWFSLHAGLIDDLWVVPQNNRWQLRSISADLSERLAVMERADLGGMIAVSHPDERWNFQVQLRSGEGYRSRERNSGQNAVFRGELKPLPKKERLSIAAFAQDGSRGFGLARAHRLGGQVYSDISDYRFGLEALQVWGIQGDALREPLLISAWTQYLPEQGLQAYLRADTQREFERSQRHIVHSGIGYRPSGDLRVWIGAEQSTTPEDAGGLPGAIGSAVQREIFLQIDGQWRQYR